MGGRPLRCRCVLPLFSQHEVLQHSLNQSVPSSTPWEAMFGCCFAKWFCHVTWPLQGLAGSQSYAGTCLVDQGRNPPLLVFQKTKMCHFYKHGACMKAAETSSIAAKQEARKEGVVCLRGKLSCASLLYFVPGSSSCLVSTVEVFRTVPNSCFGFVAYSSGFLPIQKLERKLRLLAK